ncbi:hypothetical protein ABZT23_40650 [Streptomyces sp. NPDC005386]|uniref:hypothetical protein n=1 Tax=Streptomyces sp. NPDC005386 TaxID=3154562 RepID=UPI0033AD24B4
MDAEAWITLVAAGVALITLVTSSLSTARARVKAIEDAYVERYWQIIDRFPPEALVGQERIAPLSREECQTVRLYLRLCEDELELRQLGWVGRETWKQWRPGIWTQLRQWPVAGEWTPIRDRRLAPDQFTLLRKLDTDACFEPYRARRLGWVTRWWRQL